MDLGVLQHPRTGHASCSFSPTASVLPGAPHGSALPRQHRKQCQRLHSTPHTSPQISCLRSSSFCGTSLQQAGLRWRQPKQERCMQVVQAGMFDTLSKGLDKAWDMVRKDGKLTKENIKAPLREIRRALLEADVSLPVVRQFVRKVEEAALGVKVVKGVRPDQQLVAVVNQELTALMGGQQEGLVQPEEGPQVILMAGLQGVGKTTACGKLALLLKNQGKKVLMVATDVYRPAAIDQLVSLGQRVGVDVFELGTSERPAEIARKGQQKAAAEGYDTVIVDTAGRLQIDDAMMTELKEVKAAVTPTDTLLVVDAMTGQEAAGLVKAFNDAANITGAILTKMDGDSRGGAALSVKAVSGKPIKFVGTGEKLTALEPFYPDRTAGRILDMGDILTLVEKAEQSIKASEAEEITKKIMQAKFDFNDFVKQYKMVTSMGTMGQLVKMFPGMNKISEKQLEQSEKEMKTFQAMIDSMTPKERSTPELLAKSPSRRRRIARGSGHKEVAVSTMIAKFSQMRSSMVNMSRMMSMGAMPGMPGMPQMSQEEMLQATLAGSGPRKVAAGKVRRKKGASRGLLELQNLRA